MARELGFRAYVWMGAGTLALGLGAALAGGAGVAHADSPGSTSPGPSKPGHHQAAASPSRSTASPSKASAKKKSSAARQLTKQDKATAAAAVPTDLSQALAAQSLAITAQGQQIAAQGQAIANEEKSFGAQVQHYVTTANFTALPPRGIITEFYYGLSAGTLLEFGQWTNGVASGLNGVAQNITALEVGVISRTTPGSPLAVAAYTALTPMANIVKVEANRVGGASVKFWVTAGAFETGFLHNLPPM